MKERYRALEHEDLSYNKEFRETSKKVTPEQTLSSPPPQAPPPPALNWRPIPRVDPVLPMVQPSLPQPTHVAQQMQMANNLFLEDLLKAFKTFNVGANNKIGNPVQKQPP